MDDHIPIEDEVFIPNPAIVADIIFDSPKQQPANTTTMVQRRGSEAVMNYTRHPDPSDTGEPHVHFEDGKTTRLKSYEPPMPTPPQYYPGQPQAGYPLPQQQQLPYQQQPFFPPPPNQGTPQMGTAPVPIPARRDSQNRSISYGPQYLPQPAPYSSSPMAYPPQPAYGSWPPANYYQPPPPPSSNNLAPWQPQPSYPPSYLPGPGPTQATAPFYPPRSALRNRTGSTSSYNSHSSNRYNNDESPIYESDDEDEDDERPKRHRRHTHTGSSGHHHHHHRRTSSFHGDRGENKYTGAADHASLGDTLSLIWDGLSGAMGKSRRY